MVSFQYIIEFLQWHSVRVEYYRKENISCKMKLFELLSITVLTTLAGATTVKSICGDVVIGQSATLTCEINGKFEFTINWYKSGESQPVITCVQSGTCVSAASSLYSATNIENNVQRFTILNVTENDLTSTWTCVDGTSPSSLGFSECTLKKGTAETTTACNIDSLNVGKPFNLICNIKGTIVHEINWFRDGELVNITNKVYSSNNNNQQFTILDVTEDDLRKIWTCVDGTSFTDNTAPQCYMKILINEAIGSSVGSSIIVAVIIVIIDVVIYLVCKDYLSGVKKIYIIYCVVDIVIVGVIVGVASYYIYLRTTNIGIIGGLCVGFLVVSTIIKIIVVKTKLFSKCSSSGSSDIGENRPI